MKTQSSISILKGTPSIYSTVMCRVCGVWSTKIHRINEHPEWNWAADGRLRSPTQRWPYLCQFIYTILSYVYRHLALAHTHTCNHVRTSIAMGHWTQRTIHKITPLYNEIYWSPNAMPRPCLMPTKMIYFDRKLICICSAIYANSDTNSNEHRCSTGAHFYGTLFSYI